MEQQEKYLTRQGQQNLERELAHLVNVRRQEVAARIHRATETGGTVDNAEYEDAKNEQAFAEGRISELQNILSNAIVASSRERSDEAVEFGSSVTVVTEEGTKKRYTVVGSVEAAPLEGRISVESPVGRALMGHKVGDEVNVKAPSGAVKLTIVKIS